MTRLGRVVADENAHARRGLLFTGMLPNGTPRWTRACPERSWRL